ncbi:MAG: hypothetical protein JWP09_165 [Candidatus Taylorbacteria bacterium]|nr:hypothetical protein [Candidatus Taylorbacteria bacterium]
MKKYTIILALSLFAFIGVSNVFAGGGFEPQNLNPDGTLKTTTYVNTVATTSPVSYSDAVDTSQTASASSALDVFKTPTGITLTLLVLLVLIGLVYLSYKQSTPKNY